MLNKILICGLGSIGSKYLQLLLNDWPHLQIAAFRSGLYETNTRNNGLLQFSKLDNALDWSPDAAIISNPAPYHLKYALALAREKIPLLIEKPLGCSYQPSSQWDELTNISKTIKILVGYQFRHDSVAKFLKSSLDQKLIGRLVQADFYCGSWLPEWRAQSDYRDTVSARKSLGGGALLELSHEIDLANWLLNPLEIQYILNSQSGLLEIDVEDQSCLIGKAGNGVMTTIRLDFCTSPPSRYSIFRGSKGELKWDLIKRCLYLSSEGGDQKVIYTASELDNCYREQIAHFFDCIQKDMQPLCSLQDGLDVLKIIANGTQSKDVG